MHADLKTKFRNKVIYIPDAFDVMISRQDDSPLTSPSSKEGSYANTSEKGKSQKTI